jgi:glutathione-regulated potassium-efflux system ancillary protein KefF
MILLIYAHPHPARARANRALIDAAAAVPSLVVRRLYDLYPDFDIDVAAEQAVIAAADVLVLQHPLYWYSVPALAKLWMESVFVHGWAYGDEGRAVAGKRFLWAVTTGGDETNYRPGGSHDHVFDAFVPPMAQFAAYSGMRWEQPFVVHGAHRIDAAALDATALAYRDRLAALGEAR